jgi:membrane associated rhomboid family serine protease
MVFLLIFGVFTESVVGSLWTLVTYISAGVAGAGSFALLSGISSSPLVGASAAISGLMGFVIVMCWGQKVKFFFWLLPIRGYFGFAMLPAWVLAVVYMLPDVSGYLSSVNDFQSVAYSAHIGGSLCGALIACSLKYVGLLQRSEQSRGVEYFPSPPVAP